MRLWRDKLSMEEPLFGLRAKLRRGDEADSTRTEERIQPFPLWAGVGQLVWVGILVLCPRISSDSPVENADQRASKEAKNRPALNVRQHPAPDTDTGNGRTQRKSGVG